MINKLGIDLKIPIVYKLNKYYGLASGPLVYGLFLLIVVASPNNLTGILNNPPSSSKISTWEL